MHVLKYINLGDSVIGVDEQFLHQGVFLCFHYLTSCLGQNRCVWKRSTVHSCSKTKHLQRSCVLTFLIKNSNYDFLYQKSD